MNSLQEWPALQHIYMPYILLSLNNIGPNVENLSQSTETVSEL